MEEGNLVKWNKKEGDKITPGTVIAEIETDKATMEVEAIDDGILGKILIPAGTEKVKVNSLIALLLEDGENPQSLDKYVAEKNPTSTSEKDSNIKTDKNNIENPVKNSENFEQTSIANKPNTLSSEGQRIFASPLAKRIAEQNNIPLAQVSGTGPHGRVVKNDILNYLDNSKNSLFESRNKLARNPIEFNEIPLTNIRKVIASRLVESKTTIPHFYLSIECNIDMLMEIRENLNIELASLNSKLSVNDFIIKASAMALREVPQVNSSWANDKIIQYNNIDIAIAVAIDGGLITPIIQNCDQKDLTTISKQMKELAARARKNALAPHEFQGGGFSISNLGMYGIKKFEAIINPPQSCILAVGASNERAIVENKNIKIATMLDLSLSVDHRVVDGALAAQFLASLKKFIEKPYLMLL
jgi:pyruvate dehydrogenase E2 component (dihydrolipoamide acetyltransferase)